MAKAPLPTIKSVAPLPDYRLLVVWESGKKTTVDLKDSIEMGGVFAGLSDVDMFDKVRVGYRKRSIEWPFPKDDQNNPLIDIDADSLAGSGA